ncbi:hypothetical protein N9Y28_00530 [Euryarchaeota archaeon]|nr:hypothetical protein [Euryarchaeota archaeon]
MTGPTFSPDGKWMWDGNAWIPAPPQANVLPHASLNQTQISTVANNAGVPVNQLSNTAPYFDQNRDRILQNTELQQAAAAIAQPPTMPVPMQQPMVQQPMVQQPMVQQPMVQQPMMQQPMMQQPMMQQPKKKNSIKTVVICAGIILAGIGVIIVMWAGGSTSIELDSMNETNSLGASPGKHDALFSFTVSRGGDIGDSLSMADSTLTVDVDGMTYTCVYGMTISLSFNSDCIYVNVECLPYSNAGPVWQARWEGGYGEFSPSSYDYESTSTATSGDITESAYIAERDAEFCMRTGATADREVTFTVFEVDFDICSSSCYVELSIDHPEQDILTESINVPLMDQDNDFVDDFVDKCPSTSFSSTSTDSDGCSDQQRDTDGDGVLDVNDWFVNGNGKLNIWVSKVNTYSEESYYENPSEGDSNDGYSAPDMQIKLEVDWDCDQTYDQSYSMKDQGIFFTNKYLVNISQVMAQEQGWLLSFDVPDEQERVCFAVTIWDYDSDDGSSNLLDASSLDGGITISSVPLSWIEGSGGQKFQGNLIVIDGGLGDDDDDEFQTPSEGGAATYTVTIEAVDGNS